MCGLVTSVTSNILDSFERLRAHFKGKIKNTLIRLRDIGNKQHFKEKRFLYFQDLLKCPFSSRRERTLKALLQIGKRNRNFVDFTIFDLITEKEVANSQL